MHMHMTGMHMTHGRLAAAGWWRHRPRQKRPARHRLFLSDAVESRLERVITADRYGFGMWTTSTVVDALQRRW